MTTHATGSFDVKLNPQAPQDKDEGITLTRDVQQLTVTVAAGSGTAQLVGLAGKMVINIVDKKHLYDFEYTLAKSP